jgi:UDP-N-acetylmuramoyl-L-alanyl-D-glutamate--2,6-diaminopimelate ligase
MRLLNLTASSKDAHLSLEGDQECEITGITADSREVRPGYLFVAIPGSAYDGRGFIPEAIRRGAVALLVPQETDLTATEGLSVLRTPDVRGALGLLAARFWPRQPETIAAVTGTSGKTSTAQFAREIWQTLGRKSASIGTLGYVTKDETRYGSLTTPDALTLHRLLDESAGAGVTHLAMEASSHGLFMKRLDHVRVKVGAFTNLSRDHLDFHGTMEDYLTAKLRLFAVVVPEGGTVVLNADAPESGECARVAGTRRQKIITYGMKGKELRLLSVTPNAKGQILRVELFGKREEILLPVIGGFQAWNALCALGMTISAGEDVAKAAMALGKVSGVPGRLELAGLTKNGASVFVDYAHKPDALENVLKALRPHAEARKGVKLGVVFGCGGNRDKGKRPLMGQIAGRLADWVIVTDDNPRHEEPASIRREILAGFKTGAEVTEIGDRAKAIAAAIERLQDGDVVVIAGKGHESGQIVGDKTLPFDDVDVARRVLGT